jgi:hypothetical protein
MPVFCVLDGKRKLLYNKIGLFEGILLRRLQSALPLSLFCEGGNFSGGKVGKKRLRYENRSNQGLTNSCKRV